MLPTTDTVSISVPPNVPLSELLGSTPEETKATAKVLRPEIPFIGKHCKNQFTYVPMPEEMKPRLCVYCSGTAEHIEMLSYIVSEGEEVDDTSYKALVCTDCRDKFSAPKSTKPARESRYIRYAGYTRKHPSVAADVVEAIAQELEHAKSNAANS